MHPSVALKHLSGSRANTVDNLTLPPQREITFGRDPECHVRYNETDELVSRKHLKIVATDEQPIRYMVVDLGSRNGTFVNRKRVFGAVVLLPGWRVQLGADGPEFEFLSGSLKASTQRSARHDRRLVFSKGALMVLLLAAVVVAGYAAWPQVEPFWRDWRNAQVARERSERFAAPAALASIAGVEAEWNVFDKETGARLAHAYIPNERRSKAARVPLVEGAPATLPAFVLGADRKIEPLLVPAKSVYAGRAAGGKWKSKGVIVSETGSVLSATPSRPPWNVARRWTAEESAGALLVLHSRKITQVVPLAASQFPHWAPAESGFFADQLPPDMQGDVHGREISRSDLQVEVTANIAVSGRSLEAKRTAESSGIWLAAVQTGGALANVRVPRLADGAITPKTGQQVWVAGDQLEAGEIQHAPAEGLMELRTSRCSEGGVVFDRDNRVLALCIPDARSKTGAGVAVPIRNGLALLSGVANGHR